MARTQKVPAADTTAGTKPKVKRAVNAGGRATSGGIRFQVKIAAWTSAHLVAGGAFHLVDGLSFNNVEKVALEGDDEVDDVQFEGGDQTAFVQAKRTLDASARPTSEMAKTAAQFVKQFRRGIGAAPNKRAFVAGKDWLLIAVTTDCGKRVKVELRNALIRRADNPAAKLSKGEKSVHDQWVEGLKTAWTADAGAEPSDAELSTILTVTRVWPIDLGIMEDAAPKVLAPILADSGQGEAAWSAIEQHAALMSEKGMRTDVAKLRVVLGQVVTLLAPAPYQADVERVRHHSREVDQRLAAFAAIEAPEGRVLVPRDDLPALVQAAQTDSFLLIGAPGSGKSGLLFALGEHLARDAEVVMLQVDQTANLENLQAQLRLDHPLVDVLNQWPGAGPCYLLIDALDAARGGPGEVTYRALMRAVLETQGRWRVVASVRTFDLKRGIDLRRLFQGAPPNRDHQNATLPTVRHFTVRAWSTGDQAYLYEKSPSLGAAVRAGGDRLADLVQNPFNMSLLASLLKGGVTPVQLSRAQSRADLLGLYWDERIEAPDPQAPVAVAELVNGMMASGAVELNRFSASPTIAAGLHGLTERGVIRLEHDQYGFSHHILFDYAVARTFLAVGSSLASRLGRDAVNPLLVTPALQYWLALQVTRHAPTAVWTALTDRVVDDQVDPIVRVELARLGADLVADGYHLDVLAGLGSADPLGAAASSIWAFLATQAALLRGAAPSLDIVSRWTELCRNLKPEGHLLQAWRNLLAMIGKAGVPAECLSDLGRIARQVLTSGLDNDRWGASFVPVALPMVGRTFKTDLAASRALVRRMLTPERIASHGHEELDELAELTPSLARPAPDLCIVIWRTVFEAEAADPKAKTPLGTSQIVSLTSTTGQDFDMARYAARTAFPDILKKRVLVALLSYAAAIEGYGVRKAPKTRRDRDICGRPGRLRPDGSATWGTSVDHEQSDVGAIRAAVDGLIRSAKATSAIRLCRFLLDRSAANIVVSKVLALGAASPAKLGKALLPYATRLEVLGCYDTRTTATQLIRAIHGSLDAGERSAVRSALENAELSPDHIAWITSTPAPPQSVASANPGRITRPGRPNAELPEDDRFKPLHDWAKRNGADLTHDSNLTVLDNADRLGSQATETSYEAPAPDLQTLQHDVQALWTDLERTRSVVDDRVCRIVEWQITQTARFLIAAAATPEASLNALAPMLTAIASKAAVSDPESETAYQGVGGHHGHPPSAEALVALIESAVRSGAWSSALGDLVRATRTAGAHPAARGYVGSRLDVIMTSDAALAREIADDIISQEANPVVLSDFLQSLLVSARADPGRALAQLAAVLPKLDLDDGVSAEAIGEVLVELGVVAGNRDAQALIQRCCREPLEAPEIVRKLLYGTRDHLVAHDATGQPDTIVRTRARDLLIEVFDAIRPAFDDLYRADRVPQAGDKETYAILESLYNQVFFASGSFRVDGEHYVDPLPSADDKRQFLTLCEPLLHRLALTGAPAMTHHLLQVLTHFVDIAPDEIFDLAADVILRAGARGYQFESLGVQEVIKLIGLLISDHREIFLPAPRRKRLSDCLSLFVDVGWPEARLLMLELPAALV